MSQSPASPTAALPPGWQQASDQWGRAYYIDHNTGQTQWHPPQGDAVEKPVAPPSYQDVAQAPSYQSVDNSSSSSAGQPGSGPLSQQQLQQVQPQPNTYYPMPSPGAAQVPPQPFYGTPSVPMQYPGGYAGVPMTQFQTAVMPRVQEQSYGAEAYTAGAHDPTLDATVPVSTRVPPEQKPLFRLEHMSCDEALYMGVTRYPCFCALSVVTLFLFIICIIFINLFVKAERDKESDYSLTPYRYFPGIMVPGMFGFVLYIVTCTMTCGVTGHNICGPSNRTSLRQGVPTAIRNETRVLTNAYHGNSCCYQPDYYLQDSHKMEQTTTDALVGYLEAARRARVTLSVKVNCSGQANTMSQAVANFESPLLITGMRDVTISAEDVRQWTDSVPGGSFVAVLSHTFETTEQGKEALDRTRDHYRALFSSMSSYVDVWIENVTLVAPARGVTLVNNSHGGSCWAQFLFSNCCACLTALCIAMPCYACCWYMLPRAHIGTTKRIAFVEPVLVTDTTQMRRY